MKLKITLFPYGWIIPALSLFFTAFSGAQSANVAGEWSWNANECRANNLNYESRVTMPSSSGAVAIDSATLTFDSNDSVTVRAVKSNGETQETVGNYEVAGNEVKFTKEGSRESAFSLYFMDTPAGDQLVGKDDESSNLCDNNKVFVRVFGRL